MPKPPYEPTQEISIHTLTQRVTATILDEKGVDDISIHTLTQRVTASEHCNGQPLHISIHTLTQRVTVTLASYLNLGNDFNPHPHAEGDSYIWYLLIRNIAYIEADTI